MPLRELEARNAKPADKPYKLSDSGGLYLLVQPNGSKLWRQRFYRDGKESLKSFGAYPGVTIADAREMGRNLKARLEKGEPVTPLPDTTFGTIAKRWHDNRADSLDAAHAARVWSRLKRDVISTLGARQIGDIDAPMILEVIQKVEARGALDISRRVHQMVSQVFRFAIANGWATEDPSPALRGALKPRPRVQHMTKLPFAELRDFLTKLAAYDGDMVTRLALKFTLLTWARTNETRFARWQEFEDLDGKQPLWRVPADRMKMKREHLVPLSTQAVDVLKALRQIRRSEFVFPGERRPPQISQNTMIYACYRMGYKSRMTVHGLRGLASTWANETGEYNEDHVEMALSHGEEDDVRAAYNAALYLRPRRAMLQDWGNLIAEMEPSEFDLLLL